MFLILREGFRVAVGGVVGNKLRSLLTMLGIVIGVSAVIALYSVGSGVQNKVTSQIQGLGSNLVQVGTRGPGYKLEAQDIPKLMRQVPNIAYALPSVQAQNTYVSSIGQDAYQYQTSVDGEGESYLEVRDRKVTGGHFFTADDVSGRRPVAVVGTTVAKQLFGSQNPLGQHLRIKGQIFTVIGVLDSKGVGMGGQDQDDVVVVPYTVVQKLLGYNRLTSLILKVNSADNAKQVTTMTTDFYTRKFRTSDPVRVMSQDQILDTVSSTTQTLSLLLGAIAGISLLVGGIGIMNIMLVSVTERTREIGIRKALGAKNRDILLQFLLEALLISIMGGAIGVALGWLGAQGLGKVMGTTNVVSSMSVGMAFGFSAAVGIFFGLYPALRAAQLDPIVALRRD